jgi:hypothetical protein
LLSRSGALRGWIAALGGVIAVLLAGGTWIALTHTTAQASGKSQRPGHHASANRPAAPLQVMSVTPAAGAADADGAAPVRIEFSAALAPDSPLPTLRPAIAGSWQHVSGSTIQFAPDLGYGVRQRVRLQIPGGPDGMRSAGGAQLASAVTVRFRTGTYSILRMDQLLAQLGYLPLTWTAADLGTAPAATDLAAQRSAAYDPPSGLFSWQSGYPARLRSFWQGGDSGSLILKGAVMAFEADHGMTMDGVVGPAVWKAVFAALAAGQNNTHGYTYAVASQKAPETLTIWHNGAVVLHHLANTGIPAAPTTIGTAPVYLRYRFQIMRGTNPDGSKYADPVDFVSYFRAGEAVHYFPRYSYGFQQSLGCVELPWGAAEQAWPYLTYGSLVTVTAP